MFISYRALRVRIPLGEIYVLDLIARTFFG